MNEKIKVNLDFINKKGESKHVKFYMDKQSYDMIFDVSISDEIRNKYLIDEYHEYERRKYQNRKIVSFDNKILSYKKVCWLFTYSVHYLAPFCFIP